MNARPTIFVIDDDDAVRDSLALLIEQHFAVETFASAADFLAAGRPTRHNCAIVDMRMPGIDGMALQAELKRRGIELPVIFLTGHGDIPQSVRAIKAGAVDFLSKPITAAELLQSVRNALRESERLAANAEEHEAARSRIASLTERERDVMRWVVSGLPNKETARRMGISHRTVEVYKARVMQKCAAATVLELARVVELAALD